MAGKKAANSKPAGGKAKPSRSLLPVLAVVAVLVIAAGLGAWFVLTSGEDGPEIHVVSGAATVPAPGVLLVNRQWIQLHGVRAPLRDGDCRAGDGQPYQCTLISATKLAELVLGMHVTCEVWTLPGDDTLWGICEAEAAEAADGGGHGAAPEGEADGDAAEEPHGEADPDEAAAEDGHGPGAEETINGALVRAGWALADLRMSQEFAPQAEAAEHDHLGLWNGTITTLEPFGDRAIGMPDVQSGSTLDIGGARIHLDGLDAPAPLQTCKAGGHVYACGLMAHAYLIELTAGRTVRCETRRVPATGRVFGTCGEERGVTVLPEASVALSMLRAGWAVATDDAPAVYHEAEAAAHDSRVGMWVGEFVPPREWRAGARVDQPEEAGGGGH